MKQGFGVFTLMLGAAFGWQGHDRVIVDLPYAVAIEDRILQPGNYRIEELPGSSKNYILRIYSDDGMKFETSVMTIPTLDNRTPQETQVVLERYGRDYYFDKVWVQGKNYGYQFRKPESLKSRQRELMASSTVPGQYMRSYFAQVSADRAPRIVDRSAQRLSREVRHELVMLPYYGVFDNLAYRVEKNMVILEGHVTRPTLKSDAERVVRDIEGVERVVNNIEVLPLSPNDDRLRLALYRAIYSDTTLSRYGLQAVPPIHIIVRNGNVTLEGVVANAGDMNTANIRANGVSGVFSVKNNLRVEN